jgi:hypothetical protein
MAPNKAKQSGPTMVRERYVGYDRETCITICLRWIRGEDIKAICTTPPMPIPLVFYGWVQNHPEARAIFHCAGAFKADGMMAREVSKFLDVSPREWEEEVRARLERGDALDYVEQKIPIDWNKVYVLAGAPPVWPTENRQIYDDLLNVLTRRIEPNNDMELIHIKLAADALWESRRLACEKNRVPAPSFKSYQPLELAQWRAMKRYSTALRQIERSRKALGGEAQAISYNFLVAQPVAKRDRVAHFLPDAETEDTASGAGKAAPALVPSAGVVESVRPRAPAPEVVIGKNVPTEHVNWVAWLTGAEGYPWLMLQKAAQKEFNQSFTSIKSLVRKLVVDRKIIRPERVCPDLARDLPAITEAAHTPASSSPEEERK